MDVNSLVGTSLCLVEGVFMIQSPNTLSRAKLYRPSFSFIENFIWTPAKENLFS